MATTLKERVKLLLVEVNRMTKPSAIVKVSRADEETLKQWEKELIERKKLEKKEKEHNEQELARSTFRKIQTIDDMKNWLIYIIEQTNIPYNTPIKMYSDEEGNQVNGILSLDMTHIGLVIIPLEE
jgi:hypothetical protein